jgi:hypothetical protein
LVLPRTPIAARPVCDSGSAEADFRQFGTQLLGVIFGTTVVDVTSADPMQTAAALIKEFGK